MNCFSKISSCLNGLYVKASSGLVALDKSVR
uniref:Uncharacterized protein n=1 Tax=Anguilla anguilla TaxID=7936 RepID=A0A0E9RS58_ANGAN